MIFFRWKVSIASSLDPLILSRNTQHVSVLCDIMFTIFDVTEGGGDSGCDLDGLGNKQGATKPKQFRPLPS